jgi:hypothetical protein
MNRRIFIAGTGAGLVLTACNSSKSADNNENASFSFKAKRFPQNPIITVDMDQRLLDEAVHYGYENINGPSLIRVPSWVADPLGKYYLYFAHHKGEYIRLAYADDLSGPWTVYGPGTLHLEDSFFATKIAEPASILDAVSSIWKTYPPRVAWAMTRVGIAAKQAVAERDSEGVKGAERTKPHIASPDVMVLEDKKEIRMYYHGMLEDSNQMSRVAVSDDGINFKSRPELLSSPYLRMFRYKGKFYGMSMPGLFNRSEDGLTNFEVRPKLLFGFDMRHCALKLIGDTLYVFWSKVGDSPERILCSTVDIGNQDWNKWKASRTVEVLRPEKTYEGSELPVRPSMRGEVTRTVNQLRDPAIFEEDGRTYLLYSCAGENSIAVAELIQT